MMVRAFGQKLPARVCSNEGFRCGCVALLLCRLCVRVSSRSERHLPLTQPLLCLADKMLRVTGGDLGREPRAVLQLAGVSLGPVQFLIECWVSCLLKKLPPLLVHSKLNNCMMFK